VKKIVKKAKNREMEVGMNEGEEIVSLSKKKGESGGEKAWQNKINK